MNFLNLNKPAEPAKGPEPIHVASFGPPVFFSQPEHVVSAVLPSPALERMLSAARRVIALTAENVYVSHPSVDGAGYAALDELRAAVEAWEKDRC